MVVISKINLPFIFGTIIRSSMSTLTRIIAFMVKFATFDRATVTVAPSVCGNCGTLVGPDNDL